MNQQTLTKRPAASTQSNKGAASGNTSAAPSSSKDAEKEITMEALLEQERQLKKDIMLERGKFLANGYMFEVKPIYLGEEDAYLDSLKRSPVPKPITGEDGKERELNDKELAQFLRMFFSNSYLSVIEAQDKRKIERLFPNGKPITQADIWRLKKTNRNYLYYCDNPNAMILAMWIERKVTCKGKPVRFYDLERKYKLNKTEIERMISYLHELSGF